MVCAFSAMSARPLYYAVICVATFGFTRLVDHLYSPLEDVGSAARHLDEARKLAVVAAQRPCPPEQKAPTPLVNGGSPSSARPRSTQPHFAVIGFPVGIDDRNRDRRALLRELWYPEYANLGPSGLIRAEFIIGLLTYQGDGHDEATVEQLHAEHDAHGDLALVNAREATRDPYRGDPKCTGEKILAWFQQVVVVHRGTRFFLKADWDSWIHTVRLEHNLRSLLTPRTSKALYFGNTLWCSYSMADYQPCGYGFGPLQAAGAKKVECPKLPHGKDAIGPYPYAAGLFWGMSYELVQWIAGSRLAYDFAHNASARFAPPYWVKGEDSAFGFFAHAAPFPDLTPIHWGWDIVHDGWEFRSQAERGLCTQHISHTSLVVHSMHTRADFELVRAQFRERCNATCERTTLPFSVDGLADLCGRNPNIPKVYTKCHYGVQVGGEGAAKAARSADGPLPRALPRPKCASVGKNVEFIAATKDGGTITCTEEEPIQKQLAPPWLRPAV